MPYIKRRDDAPCGLLLPVLKSKFYGISPDALVDFHTGSYYHATDERGHPKAFRRGGRAHPIFSPHRAKVLHGPARGATLDDAAHFVHYTGRYGCGAAEGAGCVLYEALRASPAVARLEAVLATLPPLPKLPGSAPAWRQAPDADAPAAAPFAVVAPAPRRQAAAASPSFSANATSYSRRCDCTT